MKRLLLIAGIIVGICFCTQNACADHGLPTFNLSLKDTTYETVAAGKKDDKYPGNSLSITADGKTETYSDVELKGRGNSTWEAPKKPFQIKFDSKTDLFDLGASKKWVLLADYYDDSHLRNDIAFHFTHLLDMQYVNHGIHVDLYVDGQYLGVYYLCHKTEIGKSIANLKNDNGVLVEMDNIHEPDEDYWFTTDYGNTMLVKETVADTDESYEAASKDFNNAFNRFERAVYTNDWEGITKEIDINSFAHYFLLFEYSVNPDGLSSSVYFYKDGAEDKIHAGPAWDYDFAFSNHRWFVSLEHATPFRSWGQTVIRYRIQERAWDTEIFARLMDHPEFRNLVRQIFQTKIAPHIDEIDNYIATTTAKIAASATHDSYRWNRDDFTLATDYVREWSKNRLEYLNLLYGTDDTIDSGSYRIRSYDVQLNNNQFTNEFYFQPQTDGSYRIIAIDSGRALTADNPFDAATIVSFMRPLNLDSQRWYISHTKNNKYYIIAKSSGLFLTAEDGKLTLREYRFNDAQAFNLFYRMKTTIKTNGHAYYQLAPGDNPGHSYNGKRLVSVHSLDAKSFIITRNYDNSYNLIDPLTGQSKNWIIQENSNHSLTLIHPQRLQALSYRQAEVKLDEISDTKQQNWQLIEDRLPQLSNPLIIVKP
ncbi:CotH kinase family protein [Candidatus Saccharibacteria bacterium]|nr:CotH kinase family protein [Candidatus Saccharibacteria bacterium]